MAKRGPKPVPRALPRDPLDDALPPGLEGRAAEIYREICAPMIKEGYASNTDKFTIAMLAYARADLEELYAARRAIADVLDPDARAISKAIKEQQRQVNFFNAQLLNTPRSRSSSRIASDSGRKGGAPPDALDEFLAGRTQSEK